MNKESNDANNYMHSNFQVLLESEFMIERSDRFHMVKQLSHVWLFATPWTVARHAPLSMVFSRL